VSAERHHAFRGAGEVAHERTVRVPHCPAVRVVDSTNATTVEAATAHRATEPASSSGSGGLDGSGLFGSGLGDSSCFGSVGSSARPSVGSIGRVSSGLGDNSLVRVIITLSTFQTILGTVVPEIPTVSTFTTSGLLSGLGVSGVGGSGFGGDSGLGSSGLGGSGLLSGLDSSLFVSGLLSDLGDSGLSGSGLGGSGLGGSGLDESGDASVRANTTLAISSPVFGSFALFLLPSIEEGVLPLGSGRIGGSFGLVIVGFVSIGSFHSLDRSISVTLSFS